MGQPVPIKLTYADWLEMPEDGNRYEIIEGVLHVTPPPVTRHQRVLYRLTQTVTPWSDRAGLGEWLFAPCGVRLSDGTVVQPDAFFIRKDRVTELVGEQVIEGAPDLVVEVLSPSTARRDKTTKLQAYAALGVREYWLLDPASSSITVWALSAQGCEELGTVSRNQPIPTRVLQGVPTLAYELF